MGHQHTAHSSRCLFGDLIVNWLRILGDLGPWALLLFWLIAWPVTHRLARPGTKVGILGLSYEKDYVKRKETTPKKPLPAPTSLSSEEWGVLALFGGYDQTSLERDRLVELSEGVSRVEVESALDNLVAVGYLKDPSAFGQYGPRYSLTREGKAKLVPVLKEMREKSNKS